MMDTNKISTIIFTALMMGAILVTTGCYEPAPVPVTQTPEQIRSFDDCVSAGYPVMESYPRQCRAGEHTFTEAIKMVREDENVDEDLGDDEAPAEGPTGIAEPEDPRHMAEIIAINHVQKLNTYTDFNGRNIVASNVQQMRCPGCFDVEVRFERDSVKNPGGTTQAIIHVTIENWEPVDERAQYEEI